MSWKPEYTPPPKTHAKNPLGLHPEVLWDWRLQRERMFMEPMVSGEQIRNFMHSVKYRGYSCWAIGTFQHGATMSIEELCCKFPNPVIPFTHLLMTGLDDTLDKFGIPRV